MKLSMGMVFFTQHQIYLKGYFVSDSPNKKRIKTA